VAWRFSGREALSEKLVALLGVSFEKAAKPRLDDTQMTTSIFLFINNLQYMKTQL
jgi:hypothetical protein